MASSRLSATTTPRRAADGTRATRPAILDSANFLLATRDAGYKSTGLAIAELVDNSLQAGCQRVNIEVSPSGDAAHPIQLTVSDDGSGMDPQTLEHALTFGGSTRFDDRSSLGRYGMGLPNGGLSRARRIEVYSWTDDQVFMSTLDIDELVAARRRTLSPVKAVKRTPFLPSWPTGTVVRLLRCDRLEYRQPAALARRLSLDLGRIFHTFLLGAFQMTVNGSDVPAIDPLMLDASGRSAGVRQFGDVLRYRFDCDAGEGAVEVRFSELPVERWHNLPASEKRARGVTSSASVSVLRSGREIDRGWFFMGSKRRENYDDWWRCEVRFNPKLDELFGITNAKQSITPTPRFTELLSADLEPIARALNSRVRSRFEVAKLATPLAAAVRQAARAEQSLPRMPDRSDSLPPAIERALATQGTTEPNSPYEMVIADLPSTAAFEVAQQDQRLVLAFNRGHPLYRDLYRPLADAEDPKSHEIAKRLVLTILAAARAELLDSHKSSAETAHQFHQAWSNVAATYLNATP